MPNIVVQETKRNHTQVILVIDGVDSIYRITPVDSITRSGTTVTVVKNTPHGFTTGDDITIAGCDDALYNGEHSITVVDEFTFTYELDPGDEPDSPAVAEYGEQLTAADKECSVQINVPKALFFQSIETGDTLQVEVSIDTELGWVAYGAALTDANSGSIVALNCQYNFVRVQRTAGSGTGTRVVAQY